MRAIRYALYILTAVVFLGMQTTSPAGAKMGQEAGPGIVANEMEGRRQPSECDWKQGTVVIGLGEDAYFRVRAAEDEDIYYDPYAIWDIICAIWEFTNSSGEDAVAAGQVSILATWAVEHVEPREPFARLYYDLYARCKIFEPGTYTAKCRIDDCRTDPEDPANDPEIEKSMTADVQFSVKINYMFSTDGAALDETSPMGGSVGMEVEWVAGFTPSPSDFTARHECDVTQYGWP